VQRFPRATPAIAARQLVLVGAGHAHVQVLRAFAMRPEPGVELTLVVDRPEALYSGMVPGFVAGDYRAAELEIDALPLARRAGARCVLAAATRIDPLARAIELEGRPPLRYDLASLDVGSSVLGLELPGVAEHALATRPIRSFVDRLEARLAEAARARSRPALCVVGGGAAGVEIALTLEARLRREGRPAQLTLVCASPRILPGASAAFAARAERELAARGIERLTGTRALRLEKRVLWLEQRDAQETLACDLALWATGAAPPALIERSALPRNAAGYARIESTLALPGCPGLFAAGDCASLDAHPWVPKAGVYAVREGPVLAHNLRAALRGDALRRYRPQRDFLALLNLGDGRALGGKWGIAAAGRRVFQLKDAIDRRFVRRFQVLDESGRSLPAYAADDAAAAEDAAMQCGGCAAKVGAPALERALARLGPVPGDASVLRGLAEPDDAALLRLPQGDLLLATTDAFRAFCGDPWLVGAAAAVNAVSDLHCKGGRPRHALALVTVPEAAADGEEETLFQVLAGMRSALDPLGVALVGGHSTRGAELFAGLAVGGELARAEDWWSQGGARAGDALILSKPLGTGVLLAADAQGRARGCWIAACQRSLLRANAAAAGAARASCRVHAATDVSGFGLAGHLAPLAAASGVSAELRLAALPALPGALELLALGLRSSFHGQNAEARRRIAIPAELAGDPRVELLFDPQTCGGLLLAVAAGEAEACVAALRRAGDAGAACIGSLAPPRADGRRLVLLAA